MIPAGAPATMRIAIPLLGEDIAPRFCSTDQVLLAEVEEGQVLGMRVVAMVHGGIPERVAHLAELGVEQLLCGGFNRRFLSMASGLGLQVRWGLWGEAEAVLADFAAGRALACLGPRGRRCGARRRGESDV